MLKIEILINIIDNAVIRVLSWKIEFLDNNDNNNVIPLLLLFLLLLLSLDVLFIFWFLIKRKKFKVV